MKDYERIQKVKKAGNLTHIYKNKLDRACFSNDATFSDSKYLAKKTISDKLSKIELTKLL